MACFYPLEAWRSQKVNPSGKRGITFNLKEGYVDQALQVGCGKCEGCLADRAREWSLRINHESSLHKQNSFLTLTYHDPAPEKISKLHLQLFFKRLRNHGYQFRYFAVGEYGELTRRPHYHAVIFGHDFRDEKIDVNGDDYTNPVIERIWDQGHVLIGDITPGRCNYVAGYVHKKIGDQDTFSLMSSRPGIGKQWLDKYYDDLVRVEACVDGKKEHPVPRRYINWKEEQFSELKKNRQKIFNTMTGEERWTHRENKRGKEINARSRRQTFNKEQL